MKANKRSVALRRIGVVVGIWFYGASAALAATSYGPVGGETLWAIAKKINSEAHFGTTAQVAWALYEANPQAFEGSPGKIKPGATLTIPDAKVIAATKSVDAYNRLNGKPVASAAPAAVAAAPLPQPVAKPAPVVRGPPSILGVDVKPMAKGATKQVIGVVGENFRPGATLEFQDLINGTRFSGRAPSKVTFNRIDYAGSFGRQPSNWLVTVVNPGGVRSEAFGFAAGPGVSFAFDAPAPAPVAAAPKPAPVLAPVGAVAAAAAKAAAPAGVLKGTAAADFSSSADQTVAAQMLKDGKQPEDVYLYLAALEGVYAGDVDYDYALGANAYDAGHYDDAVFVLQRAVASKPKFSGARMELARAYYAVGDNESARREFTMLQGEAPPPEAAKAIADYLDAIDARAAAYQRQLSAFVEFGGGYDSNANGGPDTQTFLGFALDPRNQSTASSYYGSGFGGALSWPLAPDWRVYGDALAAARGNVDADFVNSTNARVGAALEWAPSPLTVTLAPSYGYAAIGGEPNHNTYAIDLSGSWQLEGGTLGVTGRYGMNRYNDQALQQQDVDTTIVGVTSMFPVPGYPMQMGVALTKGKDDPRLPLSQFGRDLTGGRGFMMASLAPGHLVTLSVATLKSDYDALFLGFARNDETRGAGLSYQYLGWKSLGWGLGASVNWSTNDSTIALYQYDRLDAGLTVRREFK